MNIRAVEYFSYNDFPGHISSVVFTQGCNLNCYYCHNKDLIKFPEEIDTVPFSLLDPQDVISEIKKRKEFITAVMISGGEPTLQTDLHSFLWKIKTEGFKTGIETNGTKPDVIAWLRQHKLVDFIAMDIKGIFEKYVKITGKSVNIEEIEESIRLIVNSEIKHEFRTTLCDDVTLSDIETIRNYILPSTNYKIQNVKLVV